MIQSPLRNGYHFGSNPYSDASYSNLPNLPFPAPLSKLHQTITSQQLVQTTRYYDSNFTDKRISGKKRKRDSIEKGNSSSKLKSTNECKKPHKKRKVDKSVERIDGELEFEMNRLLDENENVISDLRENLTEKQPDENLKLIAMFRENIIRVLTCMSRMSGIMSRMPPIPVKLNTICVLNSAPDPMNFQYQSNSKKK